MLCTVSGTSTASSANAVKGHHVFSVSVVAVRSGFQKMISIQSAVGARVGHVVEGGLVKRAKTNTLLCRLKKSSDTRGRNAKIRSVRGDLLNFLPMATRSATTFGKLS